jgi:hypothetical protein
MPTAFQGFTPFYRGSPYWRSLQDAIGRLLEARVASEGLAEIWRLQIEGFSECYWIGGYFGLDWIGSYMDGVDPAFQIVGLDWIDSL